MTYTFVDAIKDVLKGDFADKQNADVRFAICKNCPLFNEELETCESCGCYMPAKTKLLNAECPEGKW